MPVTNSEKRLLWGPTDAHDPEQRCAARKLPEGSTPNLGKAVA
jgi:hypothetical protein